MDVTWRTQTGMILCALGLAALMGELSGALTMLGMWMFWDDIKATEVRRAGMAPIAKLRRE